jgi:hypothetical protein
MLRKRAEESRRERRRLLCGPIVRTPACEETDPFTVRDCVIMHERIRPSQVTDRVLQQD